VDLQRDVETLATDPRLVCRNESDDEIARQHRRERERACLAVLHARDVENVFDQMRQMEHLAEDLIFDLVAFTRSELRAATQRLRAKTNHRTRPAGLVRT